MFACPCCGNFKFVAFRCHSRFCPTCGNMYSIDRTVLSLIAVFPPLTVSFYVYFINSANQNFSLPVLFAFCIPLVGILNGTLIFTVLFLRAGLAILSCGAM
ncbi:transposase zinc-binding domain-containing protein [Lachnospiraceae bacterium 54-53]